MSPFGVSSIEPDWSRTSMTLGHLTAAAGVNGDAATTRPKATAIETAFRMALLPLSVEKNAALSRKLACRTSERTSEGQETNTKYLRRKEEVAARAAFASAGFRSDGEGRRSEDSD